MRVERRQAMWRRVDDSMPRGAKIGQSGQEKASKYKEITGISVDRDERRHIDILGCIHMKVSSWVASTDRGQTKHKE